MADKKGESSVLFSLRELRQLEDDRVTQEQTDAQARAAAEAQAKADAERRVREEVERKQREEADKLRSDQERKDAAEREERIRIAESERRAQVEAQMRLEQERLHLDHQAKLASAPTKSHKLLYGIVAAMSIIVITLGVVYYRNSQKADADRRQAAYELAELKRINEEEKAAAAAIQADIQKIQSEIANANEADRAKLAERLKAKEQERLKNASDAEARRQGVKRGGSSSAKPKGPKLDLDVDTKSAIGGTKGN